METHGQNHTPAFTAKVTLAALAGDKTVACTRSAVRRPSEPDHPVEEPTHGASHGVDYEGML